MARAVVRLGDFCTGHPPCWEPRPCITASDDVFADGIPMHRLYDRWAVHGILFCIPHDGWLAGGSPTVFTDGLPQGRVGDPVNCGSFCAEGSPTTFADD